MEINSCLMSPFVSKVSVEIHTWTETKGARVGVPVLSPESVHRLGILVPSLVKSGEEEDRRGKEPTHQDWLLEG